MTRYEMVEGGSAKFWEVEVEGSAVTVRYGRIGTAGQTKRHELPDAASAAAEAAKLIKQKLKKGYAPVDGSSASTTPTAPAPKPPAPKQPAAPRDAAETAPSATSGDSTSGGSTSGATPDDAPSTTPRRGRLTWVLPPGGGRDPLGLDLGNPTVVCGRWALTLLSTGDLVKLDLADRTHTRLATLVLDPRGYRSIAIHPSGEHWAASDGETCWRDGRAYPEKLSALTFDADGALWAFRGQKVVKLAADGTVLWEGAQRGDRLALAGGRPIVGRYGGLLLPPSEEGGEHRSVRSEVQESPRALLADDRFAVACFWIQRDGKWCWLASVWELSSATERVVTLTGFDGHGVITNGALRWPAGELDLSSAEVRTFDVAPMGPQSALLHVLGTTVSPDGDELWQVVDGAACVRRFRLEDHAELTRGDAHPASYPWSVAVAPNGRSALATDDGFEVFAADGQRLHRADVGQISQVAFSPDGTRLAAATSDPPRTLLFDTSDWRQLATAKGYAGDALVFSPAGDRVLCGDAKKLTLRDAETLEPQALLTAKGELRSAHFSEGRIVGVDYDGRVHVFDDPGPLPNTKKPPKYAHAVLLPNAGANSSTGDVRTELAGDALLVATHSELCVYDLSTRKVRTKLAAAAKGTRSGRVLAIRDPLGASLHRLGEATPFARLPGMPDRLEATRDGRRVVAALHRGLVLWTEEGGRTPASPPYELVLPSSGLPSGQPGLPGFTSEPRAFVLHGVVLTVKASEAREIATSLTEAIAGLVAIPEGDASETGGRAPSDPQPLHLGFVVASAEADAEQGRKGEAARFDRAAFEHAEQLFRDREPELRAAVAAHTSAVLDAPARDHLVACGPLSSAEAKVGGKRVHISWDGAEQALPLASRGAGTLVCWYD